MDNHSIKSYLLDKKCCSIDNDSDSDPCSANEKSNCLDYIRRRKDDITIKTDSCDHILVYYYDDEGQLCYYYLRKYRAVIGVYCLVLGLAAALILGYAIWMFSRVAPMYNIFPTNSFYIIAWMITLACVFSFVCILCCMGYLTTNNTKFLLAALIFLVLAAVCSTIAIGVSSYYYSHKYQYNRLYFQHAMFDYNKVTNVSSSDGVDMIQHKFECCGWYNQSDWQVVPYYLQYAIFPDSCCIYGRRQIQCGRLFNLLFINKGCMDDVNSSVKNNYIAAIVTQIVFLIIQLIGMAILPLGFTKTYSKPVIIYKAVCKS